MKKLTWLGFLLVLCTSNVFSQTVREFIMLEPTEISHIYKEVTPHSTSYRDNGAYAVGKQVIDTLTLIYRSHF